MNILVTGATGFIGTSLTAELRKKHNLFILGQFAGDPEKLGLPGCVMYAKRTNFDLVLPRVMADDEVTAEELAALGQGGLCLNCPVCTFPNCGFGKGI